MAQNQDSPVEPYNIFNELASVIEKHDYRPTEEERQNVRCLRREILACYADKYLTAVASAFLGGYGSWQVTALIAGARRFRPDIRRVRLIPAVTTAIWFAYIGDDFNSQRALRLLAKQPGPMGGEVCELIRKRDPNHPLLRDIPARMEGDPTARIAPWQGERFENPHTDPEEAPAHGNSSSSSSNSRPYNRSTGRSGQDSRAPREGTQQGLQDTSQPSAEWGDVGDFSMGALELAAFSSAAEQGHDSEPQLQQQRHSQRRSRAEERRLRRQQHAAGGRSGSGELEDYFDQRWEERAPK